MQAAIREAADSEMMGQLVEDFRDELDKLDSQVHSLRCGLRRMESTLEREGGGSGYSTRIGPG